MVWSREDDGHDRMDAVVNEYKATVEHKLAIANAKLQEIGKFVRDAERWGGLSVEECRELAALIEAP